MRGHAGTELLSSYLDRELAAAEAARLEEHLRGCAPCAERLGELRATVARLRTLQRPLPPASLAEQLRARVSAERRSGWRLLLDRALSGGLLLPPAVATGFAVVVGLAVVVWVQAQRLQPRPSSTVVVAPLQVEEEAPPGAAADALSRDAAPAPPPPPPPRSRAPAPGSSAPPGEQAGAAALLGARRQEGVLERRASGRTFELRAGIWLERGLDAGAPVVVHALDSPEGRELLARLPELEALLRTAPVRLRVAERVVEIARAPAAAPLPQR